MIWVSSGLGMFCAVTLHLFRSESGRGQCLLQEGCTCAADTQRLTLHGNCFKYLIQISSGQLTAKDKSGKIVYV